MREILFRGQKPNGEWVQGDLLHISSGCIIYHGSQTESEIKENAGAAIELLIDEVSVVKPKTVGQFTGVTDKNGVKIFEGDILLFGDKSFAVEWQNDIVGFGYFYTSDRFLGCDGMNSEVIGNVHENTELLK